MPKIAGSAFISPLLIFPLHVAPQKVTFEEDSIFLGIKQYDMERRAIRNL